MQIAALTKLFSGGGSGGSDSPAQHQGTTKPLALPVRACPCLTNPSVNNLALALGVQHLLRQAPIPLLPARHCFLASPAQLALCDPESRIPAFHRAAVLS